MKNTINILDALQQETPSTLEVIKITESEIAFIPFTSTGESVKLHYCSEPEIDSYVLCLGKGCLLSPWSTLQEVEARAFLDAHLRRRR